MLATPARDLTVLDPSRRLSRLARGTEYSTSQEQGAIEVVKTLAAASKVESLARGAHAPQYPCHEAAGWARRSRQEAG